MISLLLTIPLMAMLEQGKGMTMRIDFDTPAESIQNDPPASIYEQKYWQRIEDMDNDDLRTKQIPAGNIDLNIENSSLNGAGSGPIIHRHYENLVPIAADPFATLPKEHAFGYNLQQSDRELNATQRIVGGFFVQSIQHVSYQAALKNDGKQFCGGSIIHLQFILTAAHCFERKLNNFTITLGTLSRSSGGDDYLVASVIIHNRWNKKTFENDIALIKTATPIRFGDNVRYLNLVSAPVPDNVDVLVTGWALTANPGGSTPDGLKGAFLTTLNVDDCAKRLAGDGFQIYAKNICTLNSNGDAACKGDSGGPLVYEGRLAGAVSWGIPCARGFPDAYTSVYHFRAAITNIVNSF